MDVSIIGHFLARTRFGRLLLINRGNISSRVDESKVE